jgi:hypothetical protein
MMLYASYIQGSNIQNAGEAIQSFKTSIDQKNTKLLSAILGTNLQLTYLKAQNTYSKGQALMILDDFYKKNQPNKLLVLYKGLASNKEDQYVIGEIATKSGTFKVFLYLKNLKGAYTIEEMKIDKE